MAVETSCDALLKEQIAGLPKVIVKYYADWCGSCLLFASKYQKISGYQQFKDITFLDINAEYNPVSRKIAGVNTLPFFATFRNGRLIKTISTTKEEELLTILHEL